MNRNSKKVLIGLSDFSDAKTLKNFLSSVAEFEIDAREVRSREELLHQLRVSETAAVILQESFLLTGAGALEAYFEAAPEARYILLCTQSADVRRREPAVEVLSVAILELPVVPQKVLTRVLEYLRSHTNGGLLKDVSLSMFLRLVEMDKKTCTIRLASESADENGLLFFKSGRLVDARFGQNRGAEIAQAFFSWKAPVMAIQNGCLVTYADVKECAAKVAHSAVVTESTEELTTDSARRPELEYLYLPGTSEVLKLDFQKEAFHVEELFDSDLESSEEEQEEAMLASLISTAFQLRLDAVQIERETIRIIDALDVFSEFGALFTEETLQKVFLDIKDEIPCTEAYLYFNNERYRVVVQNRSHTQLFEPLQSIFS